MMCPLLKKFGIDHPECDFAARCKLDMQGRITRCMWAEFHQIDAYTGKPTRPEPQKDLFG